MQAMTPREFCRALLAALEASEGRRRSRKRDQTPDAIGLAMKRQLLEQALRDDPAADAFEAWLLQWIGNPMAPAVLDEWRFAQAMPSFAEWLERGAPSEDAGSVEDRSR
jgi:hypothetical protein